MNATTTDRPDPALMNATMERVRKLLAIAQDERANENEAAAAAAMAERIMRKFQIDHADVVRMELKHKDSFDFINVSTVMKRGLHGTKGAHRPVKNPLWAGFLAYEVARLHDCQYRYSWSEELGACVKFEGYKADAQVAAWTFDYLANVMIAATRRFQEEGREWGGRSKAESAAFRMGFVLALTDKIRRMVKERDEERAAATAAAVTSRELVLVKQNAIAERFGTAKYKAKESSSTRGDAFHEGREAGKKVSINKGLGHDAGPTTLRLR